MELDHKKNSPATRAGLPEQRNGAEGVENGAASPAASRNAMSPAISVSTDPDSLRAAATQERMTATVVCVDEKNAQLKSEFFMLETDLRALRTGSTVLSDQVQCDGPCQSANDAFQTLISARKSSTLSSLQLAEAEQNACREGAKMQAALAARL
eukprot:1142207-Pelagomonas_calceolata.AAC.1